MNAKRRFLALAVAIVGLAIAVHMSGAEQRVTPESLRALVETAGVWGMVAFCALFVAGQIVQVPGTAFIAAAVLAWGAWTGAAVASAAAILATCVSLSFYRRVGGAPAAPDTPLARRLLAPLRRAPIPTMIGIRLVLMTAPWVSAALALGGVRPRDHALATAVGITPAVFVTAHVFAAGLTLAGLS